MKADEFWSHVRLEGEDECWPWLLGVNASGYGVVRLNGYPMGAYRAAYLLTHGSVPSNHDVMHLCHNKICCNPKHLRTGTRSENILHTGYSGGTIKRNNSSGLTGVSFSKRKVWEAYCWVNGRKVSLYTGKDFFEACCARKSWEARCAKP